MRYKEEPIFNQNHEQSGTKVTEIPDDEPKPKEPETQSEPQHESELIESPESEEPETEEPEK